MHNAGCKSQLFIPVVEKRKFKGGHEALSRSQANVRIRPLLAVVEHSGVGETCVKKGTCRAEAQKLYKLIAPAAGINVQPFTAAELAALQTKLRLCRADH